MCIMIKTGAIMKTTIEKTKIYPVLKVGENQLKFISSINRIQEGLKENECTGYLIREEENIVGFALVRRYDIDKLFIWNLVIDYENQGKGFGRKLVSEIIKEYSKDGVSIFTTTCHTDNYDASLFFMKQGFIETSRVESSEVHERNLTKFMSI
ncbi:MAG: hypothetical protein A2Y20_09865 [Firmicutes bacterium GWF2_51_9]|nr:MAG: hypothetical protein A2Y20_09865 [Firmicutes bacterium GWF2_51_9]OGS58190.1 MAG: hypothetical protein A2Y19_03565 [Firmicutes bacterium GWE2_51_13]HAM63569.1 hypothetical protein [Erysipelotrichaceae bacterium]HBZ42167.1 hypothetical protein [Erysipelotrichaceae bacterium]